MFYRFRQTNSHGEFIFDADKGITCNVWVEAESEGQALSQAEKIGLYFDGVEKGKDCGCCGNRWHKHPEEHEELPSLSKTTPFSLHSQRWLKAGSPQTFVHFKNGEIKGFDLKTAKRTDLDGSNGWGVCVNRFYVKMFVCGKEGWDKTGTHDVPIQKNKKKKIVFKQGFGKAWFPTEAEAMEFYQQLKSIFKELESQRGKILSQAKIKGLEKVWK